MSAQMFVQRSDTPCVWHLCATSADLKAAPLPPAPLLSQALGIIYQLLATSY